VKASEIKASDTLVSDKGGALDILRDGEVIASVAVPAGAHRASRYLAFIPPDCEVQVAAGIAVFGAKPGYGVQRYGEGSHDSGANPDYVPTSAATMQRQLDHGLKKLASIESRVEAKLKALKAVERVPKAPAPDPNPVIEPTPAPAPASADGN